MDNAFKIQIPATSANLGVGFDSVGLAITKFLTIEAEISDRHEIEIASSDLASLPKDDSNLIFKIANRIASQFNKILPFLKVKMDSDIPLTRGLGSSSSAVVAGIELANYYCNLELSEEDKINLGTAIEGHPDNIGPCVSGDVFVGAYVDGRVKYQVLGIEDLGVILSIPKYEISTDHVRQLLPDHYRSSEAVTENALGNVMVASLVNSDYETMGEIMMKDVFHEPYRRNFIFEYPEIRKIAVDNGAYASVISGAGPTIMTLCPKDKAENILEKLKHITQVDHEITSIYHK